MTFKVLNIMISINLILYTLQLVHLFGIKYLLETTKNESLTDFLS